LVYFDNAATTFPKPEVVYSFMDSFYRTNGVNVGRGQFTAASVASRLVEETRSLLLTMFYCNKSKAVIFTPSATEALNMVLQGLSWEDGQTVYITPFEHNAVLRTLTYIMQIYDIKIKYLEPDKKTLRFDFEKIKYDFQTTKPNYVILAHASNTFGCITPIKDICSLAKDFGATTVIDMAQTSGLIDINLNEIKGDYCIFAGHKTLYGPFGIAGFISDKECNLKPLIYGGTGLDSANPSMPSTVPERYEAGSPNIGAIAGLNAALKWIGDTGIENIRIKEKETTVKLLNMLKNYYNIKVIRGADESQNIGVISCVFNGYSSDNVGQILSEKGFAVRTGLHCAPVAHKFMGTAPDGTVRFSISYFTSDDDLLMLKNALDYIEMNG